MSHSAKDKVDAGALGGVSETALLTLNGRAYQAAHQQPIIHDPMAIRLVESIDFDFAKFGRTGQEMALRSLAVDRCAMAYLTSHPKATVVALAEGFQTGFWRLNSALPDAQFNWLSVDLPPVMDVRRRVLPPAERISDVAQSALDTSWMDHVDSSNGVFITAEGLLMYLQPDEAMRLISECAKRFAGGQMFFDLPPVIVKKIARNGLRSSKHYRMPPMPFSLSIRQLEELVGTVPGVQAVHDVPMPKGRGLFFNVLFPAMWGFRPTRPFRGVYALLEFGPTERRQPTSSRAAR